MGTRADFYIGRGKDAEWLGSIAWDGYPEGIDHEILKCCSSEQFRTMVTAFIEGRSDGTLASRNWPWPWDDSGTTDYAYALDGNKVWAACFGHGWFDPLKEQPDREENPERFESLTCEFPDMSGSKNVRMDEGSGCIFLGPN